MVLIFIVALIVLIIGILLFPIIKILVKVYKLKKQFEQQFRQYGTSDSDDGNSEYTHTDKIFDDSVGEYVEFEELSEDEFDENKVKEHIQFPGTKTRIEDAEWEDI